MSTTVKNATIRDIVIKQVSVTLTNNQIKASIDAPFIIVPKAGANQIICIVQAIYDWNPTVTFDGMLDGAFLNLTYEGNFDATNYCLLSGSLQNNTRKISFGTPVAYTGTDTFLGSLIETSGSTDSMVNKDIVLSMYNGGDQLTGGDPANYLKVTVAYIVIDL